MERGTKKAIRSARTRAAAAALGAICLIGSAGQWASDAAANEKAVQPLLIGSSAAIESPAPWASLGGEQLITFIRTGVGGSPALGARSRVNGARFGPFDRLTDTPGATSPSLAFGPDGRAIALWGVAGDGVPAEQAIRLPGNAFGTETQANPCVGSVSVAASDRGEVVAACRASNEPGPLYSGWIAGPTLPEAIPFTDQVTPETEDPLLGTATAWGSDGTSVAAFEYRTTDLPGTAIAARVIGPGESFVEDEEVVQVLSPATLGMAGAAVLPDGTVAITTETANGSALFVREPGAGEGFSSTALAETSISTPRADRFGRLHFVVSDPSGSGDDPASVRVRNLDGSIGNPIPIPLEGDEARIVEGGFQMLPNGNEYVIFRNREGFFFTFRRPGPTAFIPPRRLTGVRPADSGGSATLTPDGDLLLAWRRRTGSVDQLWLGGFDRGHRPEMAGIEVPKRVRLGRVASLSARVTDPMGVRRVVWQVAGGPSAVGRKVRLRFGRVGRRTVTVTATDRAGNRSIRYRSVTVVKPAGR